MEFKKYNFIEIMTKLRDAKTKSNVWKLTLEIRDQYNLPSNLLSKEKFEETSIKALRDFLISTIELVLLDDSEGKSSLKKEKVWIDLI